MGAHGGPGGRDRRHRGNRRAGRTGGDPPANGQRRTAAGSIPSLGRNRTSTGRTGSTRRRRRRPTPTEPVPAPSARRRGDAASRRAADPDRRGAGSAADGLERPADRHRWTALLGPPDHQRDGSRPPLQAAGHDRARRDRRPGAPRPPLGPGRRRTDARRAARTLSQSIRTSDHIARLEPIRFGILLTETTEIDAINFIERARASCERDLRVSSEVVGVAFGWASPPKSNDLADAFALATKRLDAELKAL